MRKFIKKLLLTLLMLGLLLLGGAYLAQRFMQNAILDSLRETSLKTATTTLETDAKDNSITLGNIEFSKQLGPDNEIRVNIPNIEFEYTLDAFLKKKLENIKIPTLNIDLRSHQRAFDLDRFLSSTLSQLKTLPPSLNTQIPALTLRFYNANDESPYAIIKAAVKAEEVIDAASSRAGLKLEITIDPIVLPIANSLFQIAAVTLDIEVKEAASKPNLLTLSKLTLQTAHIVEKQEETTLSTLDDITLSMPGTFDLKNSRFQGTASLTAKNLLFSNAGLELEEISVTLDTLEFGPNTFKLTGNLEGNDLVFTRQSNFSDPIKISGPISANEKTIEANFKIEDKLHYLSGSSTIKHAFTKQTGGLNFSVNSIDFSKRKLTAAYLFPEIEQTIHLTQGRLISNGKVRWKKNNDTWNLLPNDPFSLQIKKISGQIGYLEFDNLNADLQIRSWAPFQTAPQQHATLTRLKGDLNLNNIDATLQIRPGKQTPVVFVNHVMCDVAGGHLKANNVTLNPADTTHHFTLQLENLDIKELLALVNLNDLEGTGTINGKLPFTASPGTLMITQGIVAAKEDGGVIRYTPTDAPEALDPKTGGAAILTQVLSDFHYHKLSGKIDYTPMETKLLLDLEGKNPSYLKGAPLIFHLNLSAPLSELLHGGLVGKRLTQKMETGVHPGAEKPSILSKT